MVYHGTFLKSHGEFCPSQSHGVKVSIIAVWSHADHIQNLGDLQVTDVPVTDNY